jgi:hypothetical protein
MASDRTFELGLVMAGAISAGAYTSGVLDFLFEALDAYDQEKRKPGWDGPTHDVRIPIMSGASAGGMTSAICALHAFHDLAHVWPGKPVPSPEQNRLYSSWVSDIPSTGSWRHPTSTPRESGDSSRCSAVTCSSRSSLRLSQ